MNLPEHQIWNELERYFKTSVYPKERKMIIELIQDALQHAPELDLDELTLQATSMVLKKR